MGLLGNGFRENLSGRITTATTQLNGANASCLPASNNRTSSRRNQLAGEAEFSARASIPSGVRHPVAWLMPQVAGGLSARNTVTGSGAASGSTQSGFNIDATLTGTGGVTEAPLGLIVTLAAILTASGGISSASANALATMVALLTGAGSVSATAAGLAELGASLTGSGSVTANNTALMDITATIRGYGDLTPEGIRDTIWTAVLANYPDSGTAGNTLALAGSGGVDYTALGVAVWNSAVRTLTSGGAIPPTPAEISDAVWAYISRTLTSAPPPSTSDITTALEAAVLPVNTVQINSTEVIGTGVSTDKFRGVGEPA